MYAIRSYYGELLAKRDAFQAQIDAWHRDNRAQFDFAAYKAFLGEIGYP